MTLDDLLNKTCLIGLTYTTSSGEVLKETQLAGTVIDIDEEEGISIELMKIEGFEPEAEKPPVFHLPPLLEAWFVATSGHYKNAEHKIDIIDPDFFVTWDIVKKKDDTDEGVHEWWEWHPRLNSPSVN
jgi:hypothetical protein